MAAALVALIGVVGYALLLVLVLVPLQPDHVGAAAVPPLLLLVASGGLLFSFYLFFLQLFVIGAICFWCAMLALFELGIFIAALVDWRAWRREPAAAVFDTSSFGRGATQNR